MTTPTHCYVSRRPCGCITTLTTYHYNWRHIASASVARDIDRGLLVELITWAEYESQGMRLATVGCPHGEIVDADTMQGTLFQVTSDD